LKQASKRPLRQGSGPFPMAFLAGKKGEKHYNLCEVHAPKKMGPRAELAADRTLDRVGGKHPPEGNVGDCHCQKEKGRRMMGRRSGGTRSRGGEHPAQEADPASRVGSLTRGKASKKNRIVALGLQATEE